MLVINKQGEYFFPNVLIQLGEISDHTGYPARIVSERPFLSAGD